MCKEEIIKLLYYFLEDLKSQQFVQVFSDSPSVRS